MSKLIVISNRVAVPSARGAAGAQGGLAGALNSALKEYGGIWFGWSGQEVESFTGGVNLTRHDGITFATIDLEPQDVEEYYNGYANRTLWPLFHYRIDLTDHVREFGIRYEQVNRRFADSVIPLVEPEDTIWVHDYHLIPLGRDLRERGCGNRMGFFLHIPWPPTRLLMSLPYHERLVMSLLSYDLIGFQTEEGLESFLHYCQKELGAEVDADADGAAGTVTFNGRTSKAQAFPIGIDYEAFRAQGETQEAKIAYHRIITSTRDRTAMIGVDRLDYSKGLPERIDGIGRFFDLHPERVRDLVYIQIAPPSRGDIVSYQDIRTLLEQKCGQINGARSEVDIVPIRYVNKGHSTAELYGFYSACKIALVTPLRDGMNLVAKEYVAAQDPDDPGVLILSQFAGAAVQLKDALLVNPHSPDDLAHHIGLALEMSREERVRRWRSLIETVKNDNVLKWREDFLTALLAREIA
ncbi:MAG TPA: trehalose-6-phosphate synthase [Novosphingobium sp.]|nr:trehalose-6-phosphate synthase [Novosphingobium sp.]